MLKIKLMVLFLFGINLLQAQNILVAKITDASSGEPLFGATLNIKLNNLGGVSNEEGLIIINQVPNGKLIITCKIIGYETLHDTIYFPLIHNDTLKYELMAFGEEIEEIEITSTRSSRSIKDIPTRIEYIAGEELEEKANMKPGDIRMLLAESTGIQTQQTSATSANASIRIQGLDGRYTQILKDGFPLYSGFSGGLGLLQTPPLDLKQAEVIKGSSSTLYGGGAIAGIVNLISKTPTEEGDLKVFINGTSAKGLDVNAFYGKKFGKFGITIYTSRNSNEKYAPSNTQFTAIPEFRRYTANPRVYFYPNKNTKIMFGLTGVTEERNGGYVANGNDSSFGAILPYQESNKTERIATQFHTELKLRNKVIFNVKNSVAYFNRRLTFGNNQHFYGKQMNSFTEMNAIKTSKKLEWISGLNIWTENFKHENVTIHNLGYIQNTLGAFAQNTWKVTQKFTVESGMRFDYVMDYGTAFLPRLSLLYKMIPPLTFRLGGGMGYKAPTIFTESTENLLYQNLKPISNDFQKLEKSYGVNGDLNYRFYLAHNKLSFNINQLVFYTRINSPLLLNNIQGASPSQYELLNSLGYIDTKGGETNIKVGFGDFKLFLGYTFTQTNLHTDSGIFRMPLTPKHRLNTVLMYELEGKWKIGLEGYYFGKQTLSDGKIGKDYWICGFMVEKLWEKFSVFINFENFLDARQTRFDNIYTGSVTNPIFRDIYAPLDGFVINGGIKYFPFGDACCRK